ncbi:dTDP-4-dehydrorhamnose 3,5-epimerase [Ancylomarina euxinus]|uniref:dTDP-4-dehydrorhamnose 3,5-epimerase n=1 Tax=Ancylomarina euxinus TaxID=2283627 RepID=A0A425XY37_9BACT|nr:dTDP-4-dehydrorhamnose 3,5-epimerase [Ancylomarina euxinus]MCZ4695924.1 dTDP-4-dehydrorhamnose 3,5-epimerase [Ancylomarina euxinus]MUP16839.1 dTDP-4-dehydrorhamnose 3,5-epimerase [Ancylomarina euxinus]RRG19692.1 dTDP-4-dehydrorhamnose 3,5-epimerase [Ancylomarina euxinus]
MNYIETNITDVFIVEPKVFGDDRGYFFESFNQKAFEKHVGKIDFIQDNESKSTKGVLRGLHFQKPPYTQSKLLRCIEGEILDVVVDLRQDSTTYKQSLSIVLSGENKKQIFVPKGFAHGFLVLSETATIAYKVDQYYAPDYDSGMAWNDEEINVDWGINADEIQLSEKDKGLKPLSETENPF